MENKAYGNKTWKERWSKKIIKMQNISWNISYEEVLLKSESISSSDNKAISYEESTENLWINEISELQSWNI